MDKVTVLVTVHKPYQFPCLPAVYHPIQVGSAPMIDPSFLRDNTGAHIAEKNSSFCELTALYWGWKNLNSDVMGLCHYRRYFGSPSFFFSRVFKAKEEKILTEPRIETLLKDYEIILPTKRHYWIETRESQYAHAHHIEDLRTAEEVIRERSPAYLTAWEQMLKSRSGHICNMFIMRRELLNEYCTWLFDVLFEVEKRLDISSYSENDQRVFGFLGERLLDTWVMTRQIRYTEVPMINLESQHWLRKGTAFLRRKFRGVNAKQGGSGTLRYNKLMFLTINKMKTGGN